MRTKQLIRKLKKRGYIKSHIAVTLKLSRSLRLSNRRAYEEACILTKLISDITAKKISHRYVPQINVKLLTIAMRGMGEAANTMIKGCIALSNSIMQLIDPGERAFLYATGND